MHSNVLSALRISLRGMAEKKLVWNTAAHQGRIFAVWSITCPCVSILSVKAASGASDRLSLWRKGMMLQQWRLCRLSQSVEERSGTVLCSFRQVGADSEKMMALG